MMEGRPIKFRILEIIADEGPCWSDHIVRKLQEEYNMKSDYYRDCLNFDLIEVSASAMIAECDSKIDEEGSFKKDGLLIEYKITPIGRDLLEELKAKAYRRKGE